MSQGVSRQDSANIQACEKWIKEWEPWVAIFRFNHEGDFRTEQMKEDTAGTTWEKNERALSTYIPPTEKQLASHACAMMAFMGTVTPQLARKRPDMAVRHLLDPVGIHSDENLRYQHHEHHDYISDYEYHIDDDDRNEQLDYDSSVARHLGIDPKWLGAWESYSKSVEHECVPRWVPRTPDTEAIKAQYPGLRPPHVGRESTSIPLSELLSGDAGASGFDPYEAYEEGSEGDTRRDPKVFDPGYGGAQSD